MQPAVIRRRRNFEKSREALFFAVKCWLTSVCASVQEAGLWLLRELARWLELRRNEELGFLGWKSMTCLLKSICHATDTFQVFVHLVEAL